MTYLNMHCPIVSLSPICQVGHPEGILMPLTMFCLFTDKCKDVSLENEKTDWNKTIT